MLDIGITRGALVKLFDEHIRVEGLPDASVTATIGGAIFNVACDASLPVSGVAAETLGRFAGSHTLVFGPYAVHVAHTASTVNTRSPYIGDVVLDAVWRLSGEDRSTPVNDCGWSVCGRVFPTDPLNRLRLMAFVRATNFNTWYRMTDPPSPTEVIAAFSAAKPADYEGEDRMAYIVTTVSIAG
jgi:hypothetical protein